MGEAEGGICSGKVFGGRYRLLSMLGRGGMAQVWRGFDQRLDREVAVKILDTRDADTRDADTRDAGTRDAGTRDAGTRDADNRHPDTRDADTRDADNRHADNRQADNRKPALDACERFHREARTAAALTHANIVSLHDAGKDDDVDYLVLELVEGETLSHRIRRGPLPVDEIADLAGQICDALAAAHAAGIVHRDIKPGNILITQAGQVKVCDFGIACHDNDTEPGEAASEMAVGTAQYMAPEQARGDPATPRTDLYGLGCVIYAMATGHPPFTARSSARVAWQHLNETPVRLASRRPGTPSWLDGLVTSLLAKEPADRPASAAEVRGLLRADRPKPLPTNEHAPGAVATRSDRSAVLAGEPTVKLVGPIGPLFAGRARLATMGVLSLAALAAVVLVLTAVSANDMRGPQFGGPAISPPQPSASQALNPPAQAQVQVQPVSDPADALDALRAALDDQARAGNIEGKSLRELDGKLDEIERSLARGEEGKAAERLTDFAKALAKLRGEGRIEAVTLYTLQSALGDLADQLRDADDDD